MKKAEPKQNKDKQNTPLANRVYFANKVLRIFDICNKYDSLTLNSPKFKQHKQYLEGLWDKVRHAGDSDEAFEIGMQAEEKLSKLNLLDENGELKSDEELLAKMQQVYAVEKEKELAETMYDLECNPALKRSFNSFLQANNIKDLQKDVIDRKERGQGNRFREMLAQDYPLFAATQPQHPLVEQLKPSVTQQISVLPYRYCYAPADKETNKKLGEDFNQNPESKQKFLKLMGNIFELGESLVNGTSMLGDPYKKIRELSGNDALSKEEINKIASVAYKAIETGLWTYKNKVNPDRLCDKKSYFQSNVRSWIRDLKNGRNNIRHLALLSPSEEKAYMSASELQREEIEKKHISIHHKIPKKYHAMLGKGHEYSLNDISNFMMIIGGELHDQKHKDDMVDMIKMTEARDNSILLVPGNDMQTKNARTVRMDMPEPEAIKNLRPAAVEEKNKEPVMQQVREMAYAMC